MSYDWKTVPLPDRMARLPKDAIGRPVPWFVAWPDGVPDFRIARQEALVEALRFELCWVCGTRRGRHAAFLVGPMCAVNRTSSEPPSHLDCATYSAKACPFMANPGMHRRDVAPESVGASSLEPAGIMLRRNPGVGLVWSSKTWQAFRAPHPDGTPGLLFDLGEPTATAWWAQGRAATAQEVGAAISSGLPLLREQAAWDGPAALVELGRRTVAALTLAPRGTAIDPRPYEEQEAGA